MFILTDFAISHQETLQTDTAAMNLMPLRYKSLKKITDSIFMILQVYILIVLKLFSIEVSPIN